MRMIGLIGQEQHAQAFGNYLLTLGIANHVEESGQQWMIWVEHDDHLEKAKAELDQFVVNPADERYIQAARSAEKIRSKEEKQAERRRKQFVDVRTNWATGARHPRPVTIALIIICVVVAMASAGGSRERDRAVDVLRIAPAIYDFSGQIVGFQSFSYVLEHHQYWRLITPIFLHFGTWHLLFNMMMLLSLGTMIEQRRGSWVLIAVVLIAAIPSNLMQYAFTFGPDPRYWFSPGPNSAMFGGMSGVIYALFGYAWMKSKYEPQLGIGIDQTTVYILLAWLLICFTGLVGHIANTAHVVGLIVGMLLGAGPFFLRRFKRRVS